MKQTSVPEAVASPEVKDPAPPAESGTLGSANSLSPVSVAAPGPAPDDPIKGEDDHYYAQHWGINE
jgi:hypothetical protein